MSVAAVCTSKSGCNIRGDSGDTRERKVSPLPVRVRAGQRCLGTAGTAGTPPGHTAPGVVDLACTGLRPIDVATPLSTDLRARPPGPNPLDGRSEAILVQCLYH